METNDVAGNYSDRYQNNSKKLYPTEFLVRWLLGTYPYWKLQNKNPKKKVLDIGFGDGRNIFPLIDNGFDVFGFEISQSIIDSFLLNFSDFVNPNNFRVGFNNKMPFPDNFFDYGIAVHSIYYISPGSQLSENFSELGRCIKPKGEILFSIPTPDSYLVTNSEKVTPDTVIVKNDPLKLRNGMALGYAASEFQIHSLISPYFENIKITTCLNNWWGIKEYCWVVTAVKKSGKNE